MSDFDFFGGPSAPPPSGPPSGGQFGSPAASQFGTPPASFGTPAPSIFGAPAAAPSQPPRLPPGANLPPETGRQLVKLTAVVAVVVLAVGGWIWLTAKGKQTSAKVTTTVETPIVKAHQTAETVDLQQAATAQETYLADKGSYATSVALLTGFVASTGDVVTVVSAGPTGFCLRADDMSNFHAPSMYLSSAVPGTSTTPCT